MKRTTIMIPSGLKTRASQKAHKMGISLGELIRKSLAYFISQSKEKRATDSFLNDKTVFSGKSPKDLSKEHDQYLYGNVE